MVFAYKTYILPLVEYCSAIWYPHKLEDIDRLEKVQRFFTKRLYGLKDKSYHDRLVACVLPSLELRRLRADLIFCFKIVHNLISLNMTDFFVFDNYNKTRGHNLKLRVSTFKTTLRQNFFPNRIVPVWNSLSSSVVNCPTVKNFKNSLLTVDLSPFLKRKFDANT
jgi:hypothetical protein